MSVIETVEFTTLPEVTPEALEAALSALDRELTAVGGLISRDLFRVADAERAWLLDYRWATLAEAQNSMGAVSQTPVFGALMALVDAPESMRLTYGTPVTAA